VLFVLCAVCCVLLVPAEPKYGKEVVGKRVKVLTGKDWRTGVVKAYHGGYYKHQGEACFNSHAVQHSAPVVFAYTCCLLGSKPSAVGCFACLQNAQTEFVLL
jgi:hypothetical protein